MLVESGLFLMATAEMARANLAASHLQHYTAADAASDAVDEAHSNLSQAQFFRILDDLGGRDAVIVQIAAQL